MLRRLVYLLLSAVLICGPVSISLLAAENATKEFPPEIRLLTPADAGFVMGSWGTAKVLVALEIIDNSKTGILTDDFGTPKFVDPNRNVELFLSHIVAKGSYVDGFGRTIIQVVAVVPTENMKTGSFRLTPPVDKTDVPERFHKEGFVFPSDALLDAVDFNFQVKDRRGGISEVRRLAIAFAGDLFRGPFLPPPPEPDRSAPPNGEGDGTPPSHRR
jgi:hypothetical protein